jgi:hypothetical protein
MSDNKKKLGQFMTKNYNYILQDLFIPENVKNIIEPFAGECDLLNFFDKTKYNIECYDIEPRNNNIIKRDTIKNPPDYENKFIITNPPYLARNKSDNKYLYDKYDVNDLYKCLIKEILTNYCLGGIFILPLNFWSSIRKNDIELRKLFLKIYKVIRINVFEEKVFNDTTYTVCSFLFIKNDTNNENENIDVKIHPSNKEMKIIFNDENNYMFGGEIYNLPISNKYNISRLTKKNLDKKHSNIIAKCIDDNKNKKINLSIISNNDIYIDETPNETARTYATLIIEPYINLDNQKKLVKLFNDYLNEKREKYNSLFLTNYRESKDIARKRISFDLIYNIVQYLLEKHF